MTPLTPIEQKVRDRLIGILCALYRNHRLTMRDCRCIAWFYILPNLIDWVDHMGTRGRVRSYRFLRHGYLHAPEAPCGGVDIEVPGRMATVHVPEDFCDQQNRRHPWAYQVALLWNAQAQKETAPAGQKRPFEKCAWDVYRGIVHYPEVQGPPPKLVDLREQLTRPDWAGFAASLEQAFQGSQKPGAGALRQVVRRHIDPARLANLCRTVSDLLARQVAKDRQQSQKAARLYTASSRLLRVLQVHRQHPTPWVMETSDCRADIAEFRDAVRQFGTPNRELQSILDVLKLRQLTPDQQESLRRGLIERVLPLIEEGMPSGRIDDRCVQDIFWDWVGTAQRPDSGKPFGLSQWFERRLPILRTIIPRVVV